MFVDLVRSKMMFRCSAWACRIVVVTIVCLRSITSAYEYLLALDTFEEFHTDVHLIAFNQQTLVHRFTIKKYVQPKNCLLPWHCTGQRLILLIHHTINLASFIFFFFVAPAIGYVKNLNHFWPYSTCRFNWVKSIDSNWSAFKVVRATTCTIRVEQSQKKIK